MQKNIADQSIHAAIHRNSAGHACRALVCILIGICLVRTAFAFDAVLTADTSVALTGASPNTGTSQTLKVDSTHDALFRFDLGFLPPGATADNVSIATLTIFVTKVTKPGTISPIAVNGGWSEISSPIVTYSPIDGIGTAALAANTKNSFVRFDVTSLVKSWINGAPNNGIAIGTTPEGGAMLVASKENVGVGHCASLHIDFSPVQGTTGPQGFPGPKGDKGDAGSAGPVGDVGPIGPKGDTGERGLKGDAGLTGSKGDKGDAGPMGIPGTSGIVSTVFSTECLTNCINPWEFTLGDGTNYHFASATALVTVAAGQKILVFSTVNVRNPGTSGGNPTEMNIALGYQAVGTSQIVLGSDVSRVSFGSSNFPVPSTQPITLQGILTPPPGTYYVGLVAGHPFKLVWNFSEKATTVLVLKE